MESIRKRLDGNIPKFLEDVKRYGRWQAMDRWSLEKSYLAVAKIIIEETGDENFGLNPTSGSYLSGGLRGLLRESIQMLADLYFKERMRREKLELELNLYKADDKEVEHQIADKVVGLMETLKSSVPEIE